MAKITVTVTVPDERAEDVKALGEMLSSALEAESVMLLAVHQAEEDNPRAQMLLATGCGNISDIAYLLVAAAFDEDEAAQESNAVINAKAFLAAVQDHTLQQSMMRLLQQWSGCDPENCEECDRKENCIVHKEQPQQGAKLHSLEDLLKFAQGHTNEE